MLLSLVLKQLSVNKWDFSHFDRPYWDANECLIIKRKRGEKKTSRERRKNKSGKQVVHYKLINSKSQIQGQWQWRLSQVHKFHKVHSTTFKCASLQDICLVEDIEKSCDESQLYPDLMVWCSVLPVQPQSNCKEDCPASYRGYCVQLSILLLMRPVHCDGPLYQ